jgi:hypothetical protein
MGLLDFALFGTPKQTAESQVGGENVAVKAPEFEITQYVKKLSVSLGLLAAASATALKLFDSSKTPPGIIAACLGVTAVGILGVCLISAVDIAARAYVTRGQQPTPNNPPPGPVDQGGAPAAQTAAATAPAPTPTALPTIAVSPDRVLAWLEGDEQPRLVLAVTGDGAASKYLLSGDGRGSRKDGDDAVPSLEGIPSWHDSKEVHAVRAVKLTDWPAPAA